MNKYIYVFVRQDLPLQLQLVHVAHAAFHMGEFSEKIMASSNEEIPNLVVIGVPDAKALAKVIKKISDAEITSHSWNDPDKEYGVTAIATLALEDQEREVFANYRPWHKRHNSVE